MKKLGLVAATAAFALTATAASAGGYWQNGTYHSSSNTYTSPSVTYVQPSTYGTTYAAPTTTYTTPSYTTPNYTTQTYGTSVGTTYTTPSYNTGRTVYTTPSYTTPTYTTPTYVQPKRVYVPAPSYTVPTSYAPTYDGRDRVRSRIKRQRSRIERAEARGDLRRGEERRLREGLREIRGAFRSYRDNDGYIGRWEEAELMRMLDRNSKRIRRLANNDRVAGGHGRHRNAYPY